MPQFFRPDGPTDLYIQELFLIVERGNPAALDTYLDLYSHADGAYAEFMEDEVEKLFLSDTEAVVKNWRRIKRCRRALSNLQDELTADQKRDLLAKAQQYCRTTRIACEELDQLFSP